MRNTRRNKVVIVGMSAIALSLGLLSQLSRAGNSNWIADGSKVTVLYQITVPGDASFEVRDLGQFTQGQHEMLPALELAMTGMKRGEKKEVQLTPAQGFGSYDENKKTIVPTNELPQGTKTGDVLADRTGKQAIVTQMSDRSAVIDYNHPLAGKPLVVQLTILEVDNPS
jgi:FKBP-type peptidyl-prolyl cis-trans isomerase 2